MKLPQLGPFACAGIEHDRMLEALRVLGRPWLHRPRTMDWSLDNPTRNFCYVIAEWVHRYYSPPGSETYKVDMLGDDYTHRFNRFKEVSGWTLVDLAAEQFTNGAADVPYARAVRFRLLTTGGNQPSRRAQALHHAYTFGTLRGFVYVKGDSGLWLRKTP